MDVPRSFTKVQEEEESGEGWRGEKRGDYFLSVCYVPGATLTAPHEPRQGGWSQQVEDLLSNSLGKTDLYKDIPVPSIFPENESLSLSPSSFFFLFFLNTQGNIE